MTLTAPTAPDFRLVPLSRLAAGGRWRVEAMRAYSEPMLLWFTRGQGRITVGGLTRGYGPNNAVFIPAGVMHGFEVGQHVFGTAVFFGHGFDLPLPDKPQHLRLRDNASQVEVNLLLDAIGRELAGDKPARDRSAALHLGLLSVWLERQIIAHPPEESAHPRSARDLASRYTHLIEQDFRSGKGVAEYAAALGVTATHLTRVCRLTTGRSAKAILSDRVLFEARLLLVDTKEPVQTVAQSLGFTSAAYFTRAFQHHTGSTPSDFRRAN